MAPKTIRGISIRLALHADPDGSNCRPGVARVAMLTGYDYKTVKDVIAILDGLGLIVRVSSGAGRPAAGKLSANCYRLTIPEDLLDRLVILTPAEFELGVERIRAANRRKPYTGGQSPRISHGWDPGEGSNTGGQPPRIELLSDQRADENTGNQDPRNSEIRGTPALKYGGADTAIPTQDLPPTDTDHADHDLDTDLTATRARGREREDFDQQEVGDTAALPGPIGRHWRPQILGQSALPGEREYTDAEKSALAVRGRFCPTCYIGGSFTPAVDGSTTCNSHEPVEVAT
jgi:hypothetical protein